MLYFKHPYNYWVSKFSRMPNFFHIKSVYDLQCYTLIRKSFIKYNYIYCHLNLYILKSIIIPQAFTNAKKKKNNNYHKLFAQSMMSPEKYQLIKLKHVQQSS